MCFLTSIMSNLSRDAGARTVQHSTVPVTIQRTVLYLTTPNVTFVLVERRLKTMIVLRSKIKY